MCGEMAIERQTLFALSMVAWLPMSVAYGQTYEVGETAELLKGLPPDAAEFVERADGCLHWRGEEATDKARMQEIQSALKELKCPELRTDSISLLTKYRDDSKVLNVLAYIRKYYMGI
jgi:hypothetical protein